MLVGVWDRRTVWSGFFIAGGTSPGAGGFMPGPRQRAELDVIEPAQLAEGQAGAVAARLRSHVVRVGRGRHRLVPRCDPELEQGQLLRSGRPDLAASHQRALERARLGMSEQVRPHDPEPAQEGLHRI